MTNIHREQSELCLQVSISQTPAVLNEKLPHRSLAIIEASILSVVPNYRCHRFANSGLQVSDWMSGMKPMVRVINVPGEQLSHGARESLWKTGFPFLTFYSDFIPPLRIKRRHFLFLLMHGGYRTGNFWKEIPGYEHRAKCSYCGETESIRHIFLECRAPGRKQVWRLARELWATTGREWPVISMGLIMACAQISFTNDDGKNIPGVSRFFQIVISESAFLIWKLRNQRVINEEDPQSHKAIENKWIYAIKNRMNLDWLMTDRKRYEKRALSSKLVRETWKSVSEDTLEDLRTASRRRGAGVLVGIG
ncbi:hypothetical protein PM082_012446 [Marasmius tenuissimus]|nr:hypothetical protein PM082_012446 [Marasmius tenuissimus]